MNASQQAFINKILSGAIKAQESFGILASLTLAQAVLESGWGKSAIGTNLFGIKANKSWKGKVQIVKTAEYDSAGRKYYINAPFRDYANIDESILDHAKLLTMPRYASVRSAKDYKIACKAVQASGYATDPSYANLLISLIEKYGLNRWDSRPSKPKPKPVTPVKVYQLSEAQIEKLVKLEIIADAPYWRINAKTGGLVNGGHMSVAINKMARKIRAGEVVGLGAGVSILATRHVVNSPAYWLNHANSKCKIKGEYAYALFDNFLKI